MNLERFLSFHSFLGSQGSPSFINSLPLNDFGIILRKFDVFSLPYQSITIFDNLGSPSTSHPGLRGVKNFTSRSGSGHNVYLRTNIVDPNQVSLSS